MTAAGGPKPPSEGRAGSGSGDHQGMGLVLQVQVLKARNLAPKDKSGTSDPYLVLNVGEARQATSVVSKTLNPEWNQTFEFPVTTADSALLEVICWDKDRFKKDYMGEFDVVLEEIFHTSTMTPEPKWLQLESRRSGRKRKKKDQNVTGEVLMKFTLSDPANAAASEQQVLQKFNGVVAEAPGEEEEDDDEILGRVTSRDLDDVDEEEDDEDEKEPSDETDEGTRTPGGTPDEKMKRKRRRKIKKLRRKNKMKAYEFSGVSDVAGVLFLEINRITDLPPEKNSTRTTFDMDPFVVTSLGRKTYRTRVVNHNLNPVYDEKLVFQVQKHEVNYSLHFAVVDRDKFSGNDFVGTVNFPVEKVKTLAPEADPDTGLYKLPDPDGVAEAAEQEGRRRRFRLPMSRSTSQNNLSRNSSSSNLNKLSRTTSSDSLGKMVPPGRPNLKHAESANDVLEHARSAPTSAPNSNGEQTRPAPNSAASYNGPAYSSHENHNGGQNGEENGLYAYELPLELKNKQRWQDKHNPVLYIRAKFLPYPALRQQFWRAMLKQYDADESGRIDKVELMTMLDSLGSTLHNSTINGFFTRWKVENQGEEVLTMDQAVICLEKQLMKSRETQSHMHRPHWERAQSQRDPATSTAGLSSVTNSSPDESPGGSTPYLESADKMPANLDPNMTKIPALEVSDLSDVGEQGDRLPELSESRSGETGTPKDFLNRADSWGQESEADLNDDAKEEHVVKIHECPICHMPRLARGRGTTDADIITHIATCASSDWRAVNNLVMAGFVTSSQAQRKWYSKVMTKISYGGYKLGANSANILVQDRITGMINEERMSVYVRLGIRLLYKGLKNRDMEKKRSTLTSSNSFNRRVVDVPGAIAWFSRLSTSAAHVVCSGSEVP